MLNFAARTLLHRHGRDSQLMEELARLTHASGERVFPLQELGDDEGVRIAGPSLREA